jgi:hypothetical protein
MDREGMAIVLKEILDNCTTLSSNNITLMSANANNVNAKGEQLQIVAYVDKSTAQCLEGITKKYNLALKCDPDKLVIY